MCDVWIVCHNTRYELTRILNDHNFVGNWNDTAAMLRTTWNEPLMKQIEDAKICLFTGSFQKH